MNKKLYVGNLSYRTTEDSIKALFETAGTVETVTIVKDRFTEQSKGFGFVEMPDEETAAKAISMMNGKMVDGRKIRVSSADSRR